MQEHGQAVEGLQKEVAGLCLQGKSAAENAVQQLRSQLKNRVGCLAGKTRC